MLWSRIVYPSGAAFATRPAPIVPPAPPTFSTMIWVLRDFPIVTPRSRATVSVGPPAAKGTTTVIGFRGYSCAPAAVTPSTRTQAMVTPSTSRP